MSAAWEGYKPRTGHRRRHQRRWLAIGGALLAAAVTLLALQQCLPQGDLFLRRDPSPPIIHISAAENPAAAAVVVYNENDPLSRDLADFYAAKRGIDAQRVVGLKCSIEEEISRDEYDQTIAGPLRALFDARAWWTRTPEHPALDPSSTVTASRIRYLVLMRGLPLRIREAAGYPGDIAAPGQPSLIGTRNAASVDSELAVLGLFTRHISGAVSNPYFRSYQRFAEASHPEYLLVARLDAPTGSMVRRMIEDSLAVEQTGLWGRCYIDGRGLPPGGGLGEGDEWLKKIATETAPYALPTIVDNQPALFAPDYPMTGAAFYFGWYSEQPAGALAAPHFQFARGAVACHIHSFSATSVRDTTHWWVGPLLDKGAAAVLGNVYEPYLTLTTHLDIFADRLCSGFTFAESAYAATPALSWMNTFVGDPLYRPCAAWQNLESDMNPAVSADALTTAGRAYYVAGQIWHARGAGPGAKALEKSAARLHSGLIYEGLGQLQCAAHNLPAGKTAFEQAVRCYPAPADRIRAILEEAHALADAGQKPAAVQVLESGRRKFGTTGQAATFGELEAEIGVNPAAPAKP